MYDRSSNANCVDDARLELFARKQKSYQSIPPTRAALVQPLKRFAYQAGCIWSQATVCQPKTLSPADWGWTKEADVWKTCWSKLTLIAASCQELSVDARWDVTETANVIALACLVQHCAVAHA